MENISNQKLQEEIHLLKAKNAQLEEILSKSKISLHKKTEDLLLQRENYLLALNESKEILLTASSENAFQHFVDVLGAASNASRTYIFINHTSSSGEQLMSQKAEFCAAGILPEIDNPELQNIRYKDFFERWLLTLSKGDLILGKIKDFPTGEKEFLELQDIKAVLIIPIITDNIFIGFIGFDNCISEREWNDDEQYFLRAAANDLAQFIEKSRIQEQIKAENLRFQVTMDALDAVVYVADIETYELIYLNKKGKSLVGDKIGEKCFIALQSGQSSPCSFCTNHLLVDKNGKPNSPHTWEFKNTVTNRWYQLSDQAIYWPDGRIVRLEVAIDITNRKQADETIKQNLEHQKIISSISSNFVGKINLDKEINTLLKTIGEYSIADRSYVFLFREDGKIMNNTHEWCAEGIMPEIDNLQDQASNIFPWWMSKLLNNEIVHIEDVSKLPKEAATEKKLLESQGIKSIIEIPLNIFGKLIGFMGLDNNTKAKAWPTETIKILKTSAEILANTLHSKKAEEALSESQERFKALSEATYEGIIITENGVILDVNQAICELTGYSYEDFIGTKTTKFISSESVKTVSKNMISGYNKPYKSIIICKDGSQLHVEFQGKTFKYKGTNAKVTSVRDITERNINETIINESKIKLEKLNSKLVSTVKEEVKKNREKDHLMIIQSKQAAMGEMIGNIAHQWRQPLNDIGLYIQNLQDKHEYNDLTDKNLAEIVNRTMDKLEYMSQTIDDFRNFFRSDKEKVLFSLSNSIKKTILLTEASFINNKIEIELNLQENISFNGYPNEFSQALLNILNNAKDELTVANIKDPCVKISLTKSKKIITIKISNNGSQIPNEIIDSIFNPYFTTKPMQTGTGLGLYISKTIIERNMGGKLYAQNTNNLAEFIINLYCTN